MAFLPQKLQQSFLSDVMHDHFIAVIIESHLSYKPCCMLAVWNPTMGQKMKKRREDFPSGSDQTECGLHGSLHCSENSCNANKITATFNITPVPKNWTLNIYYYSILQLNLSTTTTWWTEESHSGCCRDVVNIGRYSMGAMWHLLLLDLLSQWVQH